MMPSRLPEVSKSAGSDGSPSFDERQEEPPRRIDLRETLFNYRGYTPIPLVIAVLVLADPSWVTFAAGVAIALVGEAIRFWGVSVAGSATRTTSGVGGDTLITNGPFAFVRNPLYLGNFVITVGLSIMAWAWMPWLFLLVVVLFGVQYILIISLEEEHLRAKFGASYEHYFRHVPRFLPRTTPYEHRSKVPHNFRAAIRSERSTLISLGLFTTAVLLRWHLLS
jgi:protein-S-isoprenylcysteine O-methyltransferase Ste14